MFTGEVKWFDFGKKGYGFITCPEACESGEVFVHLMQIKGEGFKGLCTGDKVSFTLVYSDEGRPQAHDVEVVERAPGLMDNAKLGQIIARGIRAPITDWRVVSRFSV
jgi:CspA family cold shock protein